MPNVNLSELRFPVVLFLVGVIFVIVGLSGEVKFWELYLPISDPILRTICGLLGIGLIAASIFTYIKTNKPTEQLKPKPQEMSPDLIVEVVNTVFEGIKGVIETQNKLTKEQVAEETQTASREPEIKTDEVGRLQTLHNVIWAVKEVEVSKADEDLTSAYSVAFNSFKQFLIALFSIAPDEYTDVLISHSAGMLGQPLPESPLKQIAHVVGRLMKDVINLGTDYDFNVALLSTALEEFEKNPTGAAPKILDSTLNNLSVDRSKRVLNNVYQQLIKKE